jgi:LysW-gamma-L-lysine carboxypeptidase
MCAAGFDARRDGAGNAIGTTGPRGAGREVVILGHMDTVPGSIPVEQRDGSLYGRGAVDAKGPLATAVVAASCAARRARLRLTVIGAVQEEGPSAGARFLTQRPAPDYLVIAEPSGWDSIVLGYKGSMRFDVEVRVPVSHTAGPERSAPEVAVAFWNELVGWCAEQANGGRQKDIFFRLTPALLAMSSSSDGLEDTACLHISLRLPPGIDPRDIGPQIEGLLPGATFRFSPGDPAVRGSKSTPLVAAFLRAIREEGGAPRFKVKTGTSDMNVVVPVWGCPVVAYGPGDSRLDHTPSEHVPIDEYLRGIRVLTHVLEDLS